MEMDKLTALVCKVQQGDRRAADDLYTATCQGLYYYIFKTVNDSDLAQDLLQETFIEIYSTIQKLQEPGAFLKWSRQIAYHKCTAYTFTTDDAGRVTQVVEIPGDTIHLNHKGEETIAAAQYAKITYQLYYGDYFVEKSAS